MVDSRAGDAQQLPQLPQGHVRILQPGLPRLLERGLHRVKQAHLLEIPDVRRLHRRCAHRFFDVGGLAVGDAVDLVAHVLVDFDVDHVHHRAGCPHHGQQLLYRFAVLAVDNLLAAAGGALKVKR